MRYGKLGFMGKIILLNLAEEKLLFLQELKDVESDKRLNGDILKKYGLENFRGRASWYFERFINVSRI